MVYEYKCLDCDKIIEKSFSIGRADTTVDCECGKSAKRCYRSMSFVLKGGGWPGRSNKMKNEQTANNEAAGRRMGKE